MDLMKTCIQRLIIEFYAYLWTSRFGSAVLYRVDVLKYGARPMSYVVSEFARNI